MIPDSEVRARLASGNLVRFDHTIHGVAVRPEFVEQLRENVRRWKPARKLQDG